MSPLPSAEASLRAEVVRSCASLHQRSLTPGSSGNVSARLADKILITPSGSVLGALHEDELSLIDLDGQSLSGPRATKEVSLHLAMYRARPQVQAVVHLHSPAATALSVLDGLNTYDVLPPLTAYYAMRVTRLPLAPYIAPGDPSLGSIVEPLLTDTNCVLLANHGPVAGGATLEVAVDTAEEIEQSARLWFMLDGRSTRPLTSPQVEHLHNR